MSDGEVEREETAVDELLSELAELRELDRRRQAHAPGSPAREAASAEVSARSQRLMDRFRDVARLGFRLGRGGSGSA